METWLYVSFSLQKQVYTIAAGVIGGVFVICTVVMFLGVKERDGEDLIFVWLCVNEYWNWPKKRLISCNSWDSLHGKGFKQRLRKHLQRLCQKWTKSLTDWKVSKDTRSTCHQLSIRRTVINSRCLAGKSHCPTKTTLLPLWSLPTVTWTGCLNNVLRTGMTKVEHFGFKWEALC